MVEVVAGEIRGEREKTHSDSPLLALVTGKVVTLVSVEAFPVLFNI
ncbi:hypothetical protein CFELI_07290 [Corynebacterium felinum]|uniref:Uncharacterized protein n=1 Tax=Corynebacterium felinum TaxID=131318 RepID=A0ABU2BCL9_9CORY|nr:hypothetical protein [Corynebacterium felinum]WJY95072.1 hypothetical protein CFELI_07290 [Corynebacterium felinum]